MKLDVGKSLGIFIFVVGFLTKYGNFAGNFLVGKWQPWHQDRLQTDQCCLRHHRKNNNYLSLRGMKYSLICLFKIFEVFEEASIDIS